MPDDPLKAFRILLRSWRDWRFGVAGPTRDVLSLEAFLTAPGEAPAEIRDFLVGHYIDSPMVKFRYQASTASYYRDKDAVEMTAYYLWNKFRETSSVASRKPGAENGPGPEGGPS